MYISESIKLYVVPKWIYDKEMIYLNVDMSLCSAVLCSI